MAGLKVPSAESVSPKKSKKQTTSGVRAKSSAAKARNGNGTLGKTARTAAGFLVPAVVASGLSGYQAARGSSLAPWWGIDLRWVVGLAGLAFGLWKPHSTFGADSMNAGLGVLSSWTHEYAFETASKWGEKPASSTAAAPPAQGVVLGTLDEDEDETGRYGSRRLARIERKLARLRARRAKILARSGGRGSIGMEGGSGEYVTVPMSAVRPVYRSRYLE